MKGKHKIEVRSKRIVFTIELERNITILRGDSATGKTTLVEMLSAYENYGRKSGVTIVCDKMCRVLSGALWEAQLKDIQDTIVFVDEGSTFVSSLDFARAIQRTDNYNGQLLCACDKRRFEHPAVQCKCNSGTEKDDQPI